MRARERNVPRTRSVGCSSRGVQNPHRPHTREPGAPATARPASSPIEATAIRAPRSSLLGVALQPVASVARVAPPRSPGDRDSLAPAELSRFLDLEVPPRASGQTTGRRGACGSRAYHGAGEPALGCATHPRRIAEARVRRLAAQRGAAYAASPETTIADMEDVPPKPRRRLVSVDFFVVPTATFRILYVFVVLLHHRRRVVHFNVTDSPTAAWTAQ